MERIRLNYKIKNVYIYEEGGNRMEELEFEVKF